MQPARRVSCRWVAFTIMPQSDSFLVQSTDTADGTVMRTRYRYALRRFYPRKGFSRPFPVLGPSPSLGGRLLLRPVAVARPSRRLLVAAEGRGAADQPRMGSLARRTTEAHLNLEILLKF